MQKQSPAALRPRAAAQYLGIGESSIWRKAKTDPNFPKPRKLGERVTIWMRDELDAYLERCASAMGSHE